MKKNEKKGFERQQHELGNFDIGEVDYGHINVKSSDSSSNYNFVNSGISGSQESNDKFFDKIKNIPLDQRIFNEITDAMISIHEYDTSDIVISVQNGTVFLSGKVNDEKAKIKIEFMIKNYPGVNDIKNDLSVIHDSLLSSGPESVTKKDLGLE